VLKLKTTQRAKEHRGRQIDSEMRGVSEEITALKQQGVVKRRQVEEGERELEDLNSQAGQQATKLKSHSADTAQAWNWIQKHMDQFEKHIHGPPMVECSVKDARYVDAMEAIFQKSDLLSITAQTRADFKKLSDLLYRNMKLADINIKCQTTSLAQEMQRRPNISEQQMKQCGLDGWALDFIEGPEPVLAMLCSSANLQAVGIALQDVSEAQYNLIMENRIGSWASGRLVYKITRRAEYGTGATSTTTRAIRRAQVWTDQPVDAGARRDVEEKIEAFRNEFEDMKAQMGALRERAEELKTEKGDLNAVIVCLRLATSSSTITDY
jgi:structural maintenance of chromosomes protein 5